MNLKVYTLLLVSLSSVSARESQIKKTEDLGFGFRLVYVAEVSYGFEGIRHTAYLYHLNQRLGEAGLAQVSIAPSGRFAIYHLSEGHLFLFRKADGKIVQLTSKFIGLPRDFAWAEQAGSVRVKFYDNKPDRQFSLSQLNATSAPRTTPSNVR